MEGRSVPAAEEDDEERLAEELEVVLQQVSQVHQTPRQMVLMNVLRCRPLLLFSGVWASHRQISHLAVVPLVLAGAPLSRLRFLISCDQHHWCFVVDHHPESEALQLAV